MQLEPGFDAVAEYEQARGAPLRVASAASQYDPLVGRPAAQAYRRAIAEPQRGASVREGWEHLVAGRLGPFVGAYVMYLGIE